MSTRKHMLSLIVIALVGMSAVCDVRAQATGSARTPADSAHASRELVLQSLLELYLQQNGPRRTRPDSAYVAGAGSSAFSQLNRSRGGATQTLRECPMPVLKTDPDRIERLPIAVAESSKAAVSPGAATMPWCVNPLNRE